ncbi:MAG: M3 family peptidase, partial [Brevundimonas sp.]
MQRRQLLLGGAGLFVLAGCAGAGAMSGGAMSGDLSPQALAAEAAEARAVLPMQTPRAELLQPWTGPYDGTPPWDKVTPAKLREAMMEAIELARQDVAAVANNPAPPTFANTMAAQELWGQPLDRIVNIYSVMTGNIGGDEYDAVDTELSPILSGFFDEISFNDALFQRVKTVADNADAMGLNAQQKRLAERARDSFVRSGANLDAAGKAELGRINTALSNAFTRFGQKVVADENAWTVIPNEAGLAGLPDSNKAAAAAAARTRNVQGWAILNTRSAVDPFLTFADDRALRQQVWT